MASSWDPENADGNTERAHNERSVKNFLTVQAISSIQFYWTEFNDSLRPQWLKEFEAAGHNVAEVNWDGFLTDLMLTEPEELVIRKKAQKPRGGSGNNPFLSQDRHAMEYTVLIEPDSIAKKIMVVREQIAAEWQSDLRLVEHENAELLRHHVDTLHMTPEAAERGRQLVFDHDPYGSTKSPYRAKNYRELLRMVTKVAVRRYESELRLLGKRYHQNWLERFMNNQGRNVEGNALMEALLNGPMMMINPKIAGSSDKPRVIEPAQIVQGVMSHRLSVATEFSDILQSVPSDHAALKRRLLERHLASQLSEAQRLQREASGFEA